MRLNANALRTILGVMLLTSCLPGGVPPDEETSLPASEVASPTESNSAPTITRTHSADAITATPVGATSTAEVLTLPVCSVLGAPDLAMMEVAFVANWDGDDDVYFIRANGSDLRQFTDNPGAEVNPVWSEDGQQLAFIVEALEKPRLYISQANGSGGRVVAPELEVTTLQVDLSPRGDLVAFRSLENLYAVDILTGATTVLTPSSDMNPGNPAFSPNGTKLLFEASDPVRDTDALLIVNPDGTELTALTSVLNSVHQPDWHPSGDKILFEQVDTPSEGVALHVVTLDGLVEKLPLVPTYRATSAAWSPDGSLIGYIERVGELDSSGELLEKNVLHVAGSDGAVDLELVKPPQDPSAELQLHELVWSPASRHIAYTAVSEGQTNLYVLDVCSGDSSLVVENIDFFSTPSWRPLGDDSP